MGHLCCRARERITASVARIDLKRYKVVRPDMIECVGHSLTDK